MPDASLLLTFVVAGMAAGFVSGLAGVGGGIILTPVLHYVLGYTWGDAVALSLFVIAAQSPLGIWRHRRKGAVSWRMAGPLVAGGAGGVLIGAWLEPRIGVPWLKLTFALLMLAAARQLYRDRKPPRPDGGGHLPVAAALAVGLGAGIISRLLGIGGGLVTVPILALAGVPAHLAVGSSLVPVWSNAAVASLGNAGRDLDWLGGLVMAAAAMAGSWAGVAAAHRLPERGLRLVFAAGLVLMALYIAVTTTP
ncbi:MAG: sulfite exporter TauE/SafE family protein [Thermoplasmatota archaeon]